MPAPVPKREPTLVLAGDTWTWEKSLSDYPATSWTLTYYFKKANFDFTVVAAANGAGYLITVPAATTAAYAPGRYRWTARVSLSGAVYTVAAGETEVRDDPAATGYVDFRTKAQRIVAGLEELALKRTGGRQQVTVDGVALVFDSHIEIMRALTYWNGVVEAEQNADRVAKGQGSLRIIRARL